MDFDEKDNEVVQVLMQLKTVEGGYPTDLLAARRQNYIKQLTALGLGVGAAGVVDAAAKSAGSTAAAAPAASTLLEMALVVALVVEAGAVAFVNREKINQLFRTTTAEPKVQEIVAPIEPTSLLAATIPTDTAFVTPTATITASSTPSPTLLFSSTVSENQDQNDVQAASTPSGNNGNHYGQTPRPERTKSPGNGNGNGPGNGNGNGNGNGSIRNHPNP